MKWALLKNNIVVKTTYNPRELGISEAEKEPNVPIYWEKCPEWTKVGDKFQTQTFIQTVTIESALEKKMEEIVTKRQLKIDGGMVFEDIIYDSDSKSRENLNGAFVSQSAGWILPDNFVWMSSNNTPVPFDAQKLKRFVISMTNFVSEVYAKSFIMKMTIKAMADNGATDQDILNYPITF